MGKILIFIAIAAAALTFQACNTTGCTDNQNALPLAGLYSYETGKSIELDSLEIGGIGAPNDSLLYDASLKLSVIYLPFRSAAQQSSFYIHYAQKALSNPALNDTISFSYTSSPRFISEECGAMYFYHITSMSYTRHLIDSIAITDSTITNVDLERIEIYFRTGSQEEAPL